MSTISNIACSRLSVGRRVGSIPLAADLACRPLSFSIVLTDREPGTGYSKHSLQYRPFARTGHMVQNHTCWDEGRSVGRSRQGQGGSRRTGTSCFVLGVPPCNLRTMWPDRPNSPSANKKRKQNQLTGSENIREVSAVFPTGNSARGTPR